MQSKFSRSLSLPSRINPNDPKKPSTGNTKSVESSESKYGFISCKPPTKLQVQTIVKNTPTQRVFTGVYMLTKENIQPEQENNVANGVCFGLSCMFRDHNDKFIELTTLCTKINKELFKSNVDMSQLPGSKEDNPLAAKKDFISKIDKGILNNIALTDINKFNELYEDALALSTPQRQEQERANKNIFQILGSNASDLHSILESVPAKAYLQVGCNNHEMALYVTENNYVLYDPNRSISDSDNTFIFPRTEDGCENLRKQLEYYSSDSEHFVIGINKNINIQQYKLPSTILSKSFNSIEDLNNNGSQLSNALKLANYECRAEIIKKVITTITEDAKSKIQRISTAQYKLSNNNHLSLGLNIRFFDGDIGKEKIAADLVKNALGDDFESIFPGGVIDNQITFSQLNTNINSSLRNLNSKKEEEPPRDLMGLFDF